MSRPTGAVAWSGFGAAVAPVVLVDGSVPSSEQLVHPALVNYGHFTAMQVRGGATRGLEHHFRRLESAHAELFGSALDVELVRDHMRAAVRDHADAYLRVTLYEREPGVPLVMTVVRPPIEILSENQALLPVQHVRPFAHIKHVGSFAQIRYGEQAEREGYDDDPTPCVTPRAETGHSTPMVSTRGSPLGGARRGGTMWR